MKEFYSKFKPANKKIIHKFFIILLIPVIICAAFSYILNEYYLETYETYLINAYSNDMNSFFNSTEEKLTDLYVEARYMADDSYVTDILNTEAADELTDSQNIIETEKLLKKTILKYSFLHNIIIVNKNTGIAVNENGIYNAEDYFTKIYVYNDYTLDDLYKNKPIANSHKILTPSGAEQTIYKTDSPIIPMLYSPISPNGSGLIIFNIQAQMLYDSFSQFHFTENSAHYMFKNNSDDYISNSGKKLTLEQIGSNYIEDGRYYFTTDKNIDGEKHLIICSKPSISLLGYSYAIAIPYSDIQSKSKHIQTNTIFVLFAMIFLLLIFSVYATAKFSSPWSKIANELGFNDNDGGEKNDTISKISSSITNLVHQNNNLSDRLATILPLSQQRYITKVLNSPSNQIDDEEEYKSIFNYDYFYSIAIKISSRSDDLDITMQLYSEFYIAIESVLTENFTTFRLPSTGNTLYLLLNVDENCSEETIDEKINQIRTLFKADEEILNIYIGTGGLQKGIDGLRITHQIALSNLTDAINADRIQTNGSHLFHDYSVIENLDKTLFNYIMANYADKAEALIRSIFDVSKEKSFEYKQLIYTQIFTTLKKVLGIKKIEYPDFTYDTSDAFLKELLQKPDEAICEYLINLSNSCTEKKSPTLKLDVIKVITYIQEHFREDISLEMIADFNHVSAPYLSKRLKNSLNMSFKEYLTGLRVEEAKKLLCKNPDMPIHEVCANSGFFSSASFTRTFKTNTGLSPREYRTLYGRR